MSLLTYSKPGRGPSAQSRGGHAEMPPGLRPQVRALRNDRRLSPEEVEIISAWPITAPGRATPRTNRRPRLSDRLENQP